MKKKLIAGMTSAAVIASLSAPAFAANFGDVKGTNAEKAAGLLKAIGIVNGDVNGNYNPSATITRAEFAKVAVKLAGLGAAADAYGTGAATGFNDVPAGHWAAGYVSVAKAAGLVKGYDQWNFAPTDNVRYEDVLTVVERILGYNDNVPGGYSAGYVVKGAALGLTSNTQFNVGKAATRGDVAVMANAALSQNLVTYKPDVNRFDTDATPVTLFTKYFNATSGFVKASGQVTATDSTSVTIDSTKYTLTADTTVAGSSAASGLLGHDVTAYADSNNNLVFIGDAVAAANLKTGKLDSAASVANNVYSVSVGGTSYDVDSAAVVYLNGTKKTVADLTGVGASAQGDSATIVLNSKGLAKFVSIKHYAVAAGNIIANLYPATATNNAVIDSWPTRSTTVYTVNGQPAQFSDLKVGDVYYYTTANDVNGNYVNVVDVIRNTVSGTVSGYSTDFAGANLAYVTVGGTSYPVSSSFAGLNNLTKTFAEGAISGKATVTATLDVNGKVVKLATADATVANNIVYATTAEATYGIVVNNQVETHYGVKLAQADGTTVTKYIANDSTTGNRKDVFGDTTSFAANGTYQIAYDANGYINSAKRLDVTGQNFIQPGYKVTTTGVDTANNTLTVSNGTLTKTFNVTATTAFIDVSTPSSPKFVKFSNLYANQKVRLVTDSTAGAGSNIVAVLLDDASATGSALSAASGMFVSSRVAYDTAGTATNYVTLSVNGANQDFAVKTAQNGNVGNVYQITDGNSDGVYDTLTAGTPVVAGGTSTVDKGTTVANSVYFSGNNTNAFVYNNNTKVVVVKYRAAGTYSTAADQISTTTGSLADFLQYTTNATNVADATFEYTTTSSNVAGYPVLDTVVVYIPQP